MDTNVIVITGVVSREPDAKYTAKGHAKCHLNVACEVVNPFNYPYTTYIGVDGWFETAEWMMENIEEGDLVLVEGFYMVNSFKGDDDKRIYIHSVIVKNIRNLSNPDAGAVEAEEREEEEEAPAPPPKKRSRPKKQAPGRTTRQHKARRPAPQAQEIDEDNTPSFDNEYE